MHKRSPRAIELRLQRLGFYHPSNKARPLRFVIVVKLLNDGAAVVTRERGSADNPDVFPTREFRGGNGAAPRLV